MALKLRKDIKKSSYYVWFLGAKESKGLRGSEYILPVIKHLEQREKDVEPFKVTLQVSHKGLKIVQNIVSQGPKNSKPKNEIIKHFIPHNTITCVYQHEDIIACILLLFNPVTKCPLHVHAYRCDSLETATVLKQQLQTLIERPDNQKKFAEIENRLKPQKELKKVESSIGSDTGTSTRESESSEERFAVENTRVSTLYDSVAAELREKLGKKNSPILLPPRDYDTVHRQKGNLTGIELRRCLNANIVGQNVKGRRIESSGGSSGIGSDHPPSPDSPDAPDTRFTTLDNQSTSDEDWNGDPAESTLYLMHGPPSQVTLPRPARNSEPREKSPEPVQRFSRYAEPQSPKYDEEKFRKSKESREDNFSFSLNENNNITKYLEKPIAKYSNNNYLERQKSLEKEKQLSREKILERVERQKSLESDSDRYYQDRYDIYNGDRKYQKEELRRTDKEKPAKYFDDDGFDENIRYRSKSNEFNRPNQRYSYDEEEFFDENRRYKEHPVPKTRQKYANDESNTKYYKDNTRYFQENKPKFIPDDPRYYEPEKPRSKPSPEKYSSRSDRDEKSIRSQDYFEDSTIRRPAQYRQRSPSPEESKAPRDRFKDAKEKFLLMERERVEMEKRMPEPPLSPVHNNNKDKNFVKRHDSMAYTSKDRYDDRYYDDRNDRQTADSHPKPAPRNLPEEVRYRRDVPLERYRNTDKFDPKRRSMFSLIEEEHRKNSNEIAKELKRRSYLETTNTNYEEEYNGYSRDRHDDRYNSMDSYSKSAAEVDKVAEMKYQKNQKLKNAAGYRHSYAEPKLRMEKNGKKHFAEMLHRTNSSVSNNGRVGIASVHPY